MVCSGVVAFLLFLLELSLCLIDGFYKIKIKIMVVMMMKLIIIVMIII